MTTGKLRAWASAKVNLFLHVGPVQPNGRHPLDSLVVFAGPEAADMLEVVPADALSLALSGPGAAGLDAGADNLVIRAAEALRAAAGIRSGAAISLDKHLPVAGGIGGGSADAATALRLLTELWKLDPSHAVSVAPSLGGDVPVALHGHPALMQGEGERVLPVSVLPVLPALLVNPGIACPTGPVFRAYDAAGGGAAFQVHQGVPEFADADGLVRWLEDQRNDLEAPAVGLVPEIQGVLDELRRLEGARLVRMSGSGATCFVLFESGNAAKAAEAEVHRRHPGWWARATRLGSGE
ncbi:MAG: 4-(cytidine 5'-diphospho)-2-C-methyl-D-erythritol kinase [Hyphomonas sp.]|uniref:4-(cytidine 5'-diphospho)-2-C-methyl-D-erythritol kinase n=1 Tax=Hyphomonas sp. TaxID=87 RepID=UPI003527C2F6